MAKKPKFVNKYENYHERRGTIQNDKVSKTNTEFAEDCNIYNCIEKYGITALMRKTQAEDYYYDDFNNQPKTLMDRLQQKQNLNNYFANLPATVRKKFGDSADLFYEKFKAGEFAEMKTTGILNDELINAYKGGLNNDTTNTIETTTMEEKTTSDNSISTDTP